MIATNAMEIREGHMVAVLSDDPTWPPPWIGECKGISGKDITILWYKGSYTSTWKPAKVRNGRQWEDWVSTVHTSSIILYDFKLTSTGRLRKTCVHHLKRKYEENSH